MHWDRSSFWDMDNVKTWLKSVEDILKPVCNECLDRVWSWCISLDDTWVLAWTVPSPSVYTVCEESLTCWQQRYSWWKAVSAKIKRQFGHVSGQIWDLFQQIQWKEGIFLPVQQLVFQVLKMTSKKEKAPSYEQIILKLSFFPPSFLLSLLIPSSFPPTHIYWVSIICVRWVQNI